MLTMQSPECEEKFSSGERTYTGETSLDFEGVTPRLLFDVAFGDKSNEFLQKLIEQCGNTDVQITASNWQTSGPKKSQSIAPNQKNTNHECPSMQRKVNIATAANGGGFSIFGKKRVTMVLEQNSYFPNNDKFVLYSISKSEADEKKYEYSVIEKWEIRKTAETQLCVRVQASLVCHAPMDSSVSITLLRSRSLRHCQTRFNQWQRLIQQRLFEMSEKKLAHSRILEQFHGHWNKLNSYFVITIREDNIVYQDGSSFKVCAFQKDSAPSEQPKYGLKALYSESAFEGFISEDKQKLQWSNGSVWIRNGYSKYAGNFRDNNGRKVCISENGTIEHVLPGGTTMKLRFLLTSADEFAFQYRRKIIRGTLDTASTDIIKLSTNEIWTRATDIEEKEEPVSKSSDDKVKPVATPKPNATPQSDVKISAPDPVSPAPISTVISASSTVSIAAPPLNCVATQLVGKKLAQIPEAIESEVLTSSASSASSSQQSSTDVEEELKEEASEAQQDMAALAAITPEESNHPDESMVERTPPPPPMMDTDCDLCDMSVLEQFDEFSKEMSKFETFEIEPSHSEMDHLTSCGMEVPREYSISVSHDWSLIAMPTV